MIAKLEAGVMRVTLASLRSFQFCRKAQNLCTAAVLHNFSCGILLFFVLILLLAQARRWGPNAVGFTVGEHVPEDRS